MAAGDWLSGSGSGPLSAVMLTSGADMNYHQRAATSGDNRVGSACGRIVRIYPRCYQCGLGAAAIWSAKAGEVRRWRLREDCRKGPVQKGDEWEGGSVVEKLKVSLGS